MISTKNLAPSVFNNFVPNYKTLATIAQIFSNKTSPKNKIILENQIIDRHDKSQMLKKKKVPV